MFKILFFAAIFAAVYFGWRSMRMKQIRLEDELRKQKAAKSPEGVPMLRCARCGVYISKTDAVEGAGRYFCSEEHRRLGAKGRDEN